MSELTLPPSLQSVEHVKSVRTPAELRYEYTPGAATTRFLTGIGQKKIMGESIADDTLPATVDVEQQVIDAQLVARILREVSDLSALDREIFRLCAAEGYAYQAAAEELGVAHGVVRNRLSRIRTRLRTSVKEST